METGCLERSRGDRKSKGRVVNIGRAELASLYECLMRYVDEIG